MGSNRKRLLAYIGLVIIMTAGLYLLQAQTADRLKANQLASCLRGNKVREEINSQQIILSGFLKTSREARLRAAAIWKAQGNEKQFKLNISVAFTYKKYLRKLSPVNPINCLKVIK